MMKAVLCTLATAVAVAATSRVASAQFGRNPADPWGRPSFAPPINNGQDGFGPRPSGMPQGNDGFGSFGTGRFGKSRSKKGGLDSWRPGFPGRPSVDDPLSRVRRPGTPWPEVSTGNPAVDELLRQHTSPFTPPGHGYVGGFGPAGPGGPQFPNPTGNFTGKRNGKASIPQPENFPNVNGRPNRPPDFNSQLLIPKAVLPPPRPKTISFDSPKRGRPAAVPAWVWSKGSLGVLVGALVLGILGGFIHRKLAAQ